jgi:hypothetical protein
MAAANARRLWTLLALLVARTGAALVAPTGAALVPNWPVQWATVNSTIAMPCQNETLFQPDERPLSLKLAIVDTDWSTGRGVWATAHPMNCSQVGSVGRRQGGHAALSTTRPLLPVRADAGRAGEEAQRERPRRRPLGLLRVLAWCESPCGTARPRGRGCPHCVNTGITRDRPPPPTPTPIPLSVQGRLVRVANPSARPWFYRNAIKALPFFRPVQRVIADPAYAAWFVPFAAGVTPHVPPCDDNWDPPLCR